MEMEMELEIIVRKLLGRNCDGKSRARGRKKAARRIFLGNNLLQKEHISDISMSTVNEYESMRRLEGFYRY